MYEFFEDEKRYYLVTEICKGGELFDEILQRGKFSERDGAVLMKQVLSCINYCHQANIVHRDLKPENLLYETEDEHSSIKITDFGLARFVHNELATTACGTPNYVAPEIIQGQGYGKEVDYWSIGVIIYIM